MPKQDSPNGNKPVQTLRHRRLKATVWCNQSGQGSTFHNVTLSRSYKDEQGWHESQSFGFDDLMNLVKLLLDAHSFIASQKSGEKSSVPSPRQTARQAPAAFRH